jgi:hypothetical protein
MERLPGETPVQTPEFLGQLATVQALIHSHSNDGRLAEAADRPGGRHLVSIGNYIRTFMRQLPGDTSLPPGSGRSLRVVDAHWRQLPHGVVPVDLWANNTLVTGDRLSGVIDWNDTHYAPRLLCTAMALWGAYVASDGDFQVAREYMATYRKHLRPGLTQTELRLWPHMMISRAFTSWYGARLIGEEDAHNDERLIGKLVADVRPYL